MWYQITVAVLWTKTAAEETIDEEYYKKFLEYQILQNPSWLQKIETIMNPIFGKSIAFYFQKNNDFS